MNKANVVTYMLLSSKFLNYLTVLFVYKNYILKKLYKWNEKIRILVNFIFLLKNIMIKHSFCFYERWFYTFDEINSTLIMRHITNQF